MKNFDVIIVGASFAGSILASLLNKNLNILVLDRKKDVQATIDTTGLITNNTKTYIEKYIGNVDECITNNINSLGVVSTDFEKYFLSKVDKPWIYTTNPNKIIQQAQIKCGKNVTFAYENELTGVSKIDEGWLLKIKKKPSVQTKYLIGADGALSQVGLQINQLSKNDKFLIGFEKVFSGKILKGEHGSDIFHFWFGDLALGYGGWISPDKINRTDTVRVGFAIHKHMFNQQVNFQKFIDKLVNHKWIEIGEELDYFADLIPVGGVLKNPVYKNSALIGDAAGVCGPFAADGIRGAVASAVAIAKQINNNIDLDTNKFHKDIEEETKLISYIGKQLRYRKLWNLFRSNETFDKLFDICNKDKEVFLANYINSKESGVSLSRSLLKFSNLPDLTKLAISVTKDSFRNLA